MIQTVMQDAVTITFRTLDILLRFIFLSKFRITGFLQQFEITTYNLVHHILAMNSALLD